MRFNLSEAPRAVSALVLLSFLAMPGAAPAEPRSKTPQAFDLSLPPPTEHFAAPTAPNPATPDNGDPPGGNPLERRLDIGPRLQVNPEMREPNEHDLNDPSRPNRTLEPQLRLRLPL